MQTETRPVRDERTGEVILYDMYVDSKWCGSRRTLEQCAAFFESLERGAQLTRTGLSA